jgi:hypothetical protein
MLYGIEEEQLIALPYEVSLKIKFSTLPFPAFGTGVQAEDKGLSDESS